MNPTQITVRTPGQMPEALSWLRLSCARAGIAPVIRAGLIVAVADLIRAAHTAGAPARLTAAVTGPADGGRHDAGPRDGGPHLVLSVSPGGYVPPFPDGILPSPVPDGNGITWRIPAGAAPLNDGPLNDLPPSDGPLSDGPPSPEPAAYEEELRAMAALARRNAEDLAALDAELAETNRGVVELYVDLEERDKKLRRAHRAIFRSLEDALRPPPPEVNGLQFGVVYRPAESDAPTGGDLYDWFMLPDGDLQVAVVDVVGHGVESTRDALNVTHALRVLGLQGCPLDTIVAEAGTLLQTAFPDLMATLMIARINVTTGHLRVAGGSHPPLVLTQPGQPSAFLYSMGLGIGYMRPGTEATAEAVMAPGATAFLYTDGLVEATLDLNQGLDDLLASTDRHRHRPVPELAGHVVADLHQRVLHSDDTLLLAVRWNGPFVE